MFIGLDIDFPVNPEINLIVNGHSIKISEAELRKFIVECEWALSVIDNAKRNDPTKPYLEMQNENVAS